LSKDSIHRPNQRETSLSRQFVIIFAEHISIFNAYLEYCQLPITRWDGKDTLESRDEWVVLVLVEDEAMAAAGSAIHVMFVDKVLIFTLCSNQ